MLKRVSIGLVLALLVALPATAQDFQEGLAAYNRGDYATALRDLRPLAVQGHAKAQHNLAVMYLRGQGVPQDDVEAVAWFRKAAGQGLAEAQHNLSFMYLKGEGVPRDYAEAEKWFRKAAEQGHANAKINLRFMHEMGLGVATKAPPTPPRGDFRVQLSAVKSRDQAVKEAERLNWVHKLILGSLKIVPIRADLGKRGVFYRLRAGPLSDRASANSLCRKLSARKQGCIVVKR